MRCLEGSSVRDRSYRWFALIACLLAPSALAAQASEGSEMRGTASQALFDEGRRLLEAGNYVEACAKLDESYRLDAAAGTLLNLALCHEQQGRSASAWFEYHD